MLSYFLHNTNHCYLKHLKRSEPSLYGWLNKQILGNLWAILQQFYFDKQSRKIFQAFQKLKILIFLLSIGVLPMLSYYLKPLLKLAWNWLYCQTSVCVYMLLLREIFR